MQRIVISVTNDLVTDQRVMRSCSVLHDQGYDITLVGRRLPGSAPLNRPYKTVRMRLLFRKKAFFYAEYNFRLFLRLLFSRADAFYANDTDTLPACWLAFRLRRKSLFFDAHEIFPEVPELVGRPFVKSVWRKIEDKILPRIRDAHNAAAVTVCQSFADFYKQHYGLEMRVVRNVPMSYPECSDSDCDIQNILSAIPEGKKMLLYQGAVNIGRGVEWILDAMQYLPECHYVIAGVGDEYQRLKDYSASKGWSDRVTFLGRLEPRQLHALTPHADLGLALLENRGLNYYYTLPNRISDFVQGGVPILGTDFPEVRRVVEKYQIGTLIPPQPFDSETMHSEPPDSVQLAETVRQTLAYWDAVDADDRKTRFSSAAADLSWENDKKVLLQQFSTIFPTS